MALHHAACGESGAALHCRASCSCRELCETGLRLLGRAAERGDRNGARSKSGEGWMLLLIHLPRGLVIFSGFLNNCRTTDIRSSPSEVMREERWDLWELLRRAGAVPVSRSCRPGDSGLSPLNLGTQVSPQNAGRVPVVARGQAGCAAKALPWQGRWLGSNSMSERCC